MSKSHNDTGGGHCVLCGVHIRAIRLLKLTSCPNWAGTREMIFITPICEACAVNRKNPEPREEVRAMLEEWLRNQAG